MLAEGSCTLSDSSEVEWDRRLTSHSQLKVNSGAPRIYPTKLKISGTIEPLVLRERLLLGLVSMSDPDIKITDDDRRQVDGGTLITQIGIDSEEVEWRKDFTQFDERDRERLEGLYDSLDRVADDLVEEFYDHLQSYEESIKVLDSSSKSVSALKRSQSEYLRDLGRGEYGQAYFERRARIGKIHDMLELGPKMYLGAYSIYYEGLISTIVEDAKRTFDVQVASAKNSASTDESTEQKNGYGDSEAKTAVDFVADHILSMLKLLSMDQQVAMDTYIHSYSRKLEAELERRSTVTGEINTAIKDLQESANNVAQSSQQISAIASDQTESMEEVASEMDELSATVEEIATTTDEVQATSDRALDLAEDGQNAATDGIAAMNRVSEETRRSGEDVRELNERIDEIDEIVETINDIADQTNLLALNASIEAAREERDGAGFAVVADEVKALADESREQAGMIERMVTEIQDETQATVESLEETAENVAESVDRVELALDHLNDIADVVEKTASEIREVADATDDQAASTEEVAEMAQQSLTMAKEVSSEVDEVAAANDEQTAMVNQIRESMARLADE